MKYQKPICELLVVMFSMRVKQICLLNMCLCDDGFPFFFCEITSLRILFGYLTLTHLVMCVDMSFQTNVSDVHLVLCIQLVLIERLTEHVTDLHREYRKYVDVNNALFFAEQ